MSSRLTFLDAARGIAVLLVVVSHGIEQLLHATYSRSSGEFHYGHFGVFLFFFCSGFIIPASIERHHSLSRFWAGRFFRLYPPYWFAIGLLLLAGVTTTRDLPTVLANLTMLQPIFGYNHLVSFFWTLTVEIIFYLLVSVLFIVGLHRQGVAVALLLLLGTMSIEVAARLLRGYAFPYGVLTNLAAMSVGTVFYSFGQHEISRRQLLIVLAVAAVALGLPAWLSYPGFLLARLAALLCFWLLFVLRAAHFPRWLCFVGRISYSVYLLHILPIRLVDPPGGALVSIAVWVALALLLGTASYYGVERQAIATGRATMAKQATPAPKNNAPEGPTSS